LPHQAYDKKSIALSQLETALRLFEEGQDFFSVITLAGAADEIFGQLVTIGGGESSLASLKKAGAAIYEYLFGEPGDERAIAYRANRARNALKHHDSGSSPTITFDARQEAIDMLTRAIDNYWTLEESLTPAMEQFEKAQRET
jgi:hypothetical protein